MAEQFTCTHDCPFEVQSNDSDEVVEMAQRHYQNAHGQTIERDEVRDRMQST